MGATPTYGFPYPAGGDSPHGPNQIQALATAVEAKVVGLDATDTALRNLLKGITPPSLTATGSLGATVAVVAGAVTIPDPGFPYRIVASGSYGWAMANGAVEGLIGGHITIDSTTYNVNEMARGFGHADETGANGTQSTLIIPRRKSWGFTPFTGSHTVRLILKNWDNTQPMNVLNTTGEASFEVEIEPV
jgi:hypothetical protein